MVEPNSPALPRVVWTVAGLVHAVADALASRFAACTVRGELSAFSRAASGHCYFCLKDGDGDAALIRCAMFRRTAGMLDFSPTDGQLVELRGRLTVYEPRGELQFVVEAMQRAGAGALFEQFMRLKAKLQAEGLFEAARKRELPAFPRRVGVVTSLGAAALRDVASALARRAPHVGAILYPSPVQGTEAPAALVQAIQLAARRAEVDVLIVCRGGGSLEDLWAFNDERVVRAIAASPIPVVCGVGHETDVTLADFAADLRAPTPTAAAELVAPAADACLATLQALAAQMRRRSRHLLDSHAQRLDAAAQRLARPGQAVRRQADALALLAHRLRTSAGQAAPLRLVRVDQQQDRLRRAAAVLLSRHAQRVDALEDRLTALDPKRVLKRGYAWLADDAGRPVQSVAQMSLGQSLGAVLADGSATVEVIGVAPSLPD
ncbi:exodeoxyribonuclease VII large subunit [Piscinibacter sp.]|uniref:exodeoxyribonuclease VII large subunit n=1 Tax=Piscinibacter sp. TaxID=1903157 RepID=UPI002C0C6DAB|nr:exodeoxyribonuclease VII large subunit [Albitalea sp.]HUG25155.1 exodeoxyribonuclease VII large subunit [Albitalea sp.]